MSGAFAELNQVVTRAMAAWKPPRKLSLSAWADEYYALSAETAAEPGRWKTLPYQREIMDAITDPEVTWVALQKSARVGYTLMMCAGIGYFMHQDPSSVMVIQPTVDDAKNFSKESIAPMLRDVPVLKSLGVREHDDKPRGPKDSSATLTHKSYPGGILSLTGANSGTGFRRISRRVILFDEVDAYPPSAGSEGDQIKLGEKRSQAFWNRKMVAGSTPLLAGSSRIEELFEAGDQRRYHVPCPHCGHMDFLSFRERKDGRAHYMQWEDGDPWGAYFVCRGNGCIIEHRHKRWMIERGEWRPDRADAPPGHRSYHLWAALSYLPNSTWGDIAAEFVDANSKGPEKLKTFVNTVLGETWHDKGEAPDHERLFQRREKYPMGSVPSPAVIVLTAGVDVQKDRLEWEVVGWTATKESYSVDAGAFYGDTSAGAVWKQLDGLLEREFVGVDGRVMTIRMMAVDSGYNTQEVYGYCRLKPMDRVIATKGVAKARALFGAPSVVDVTLNGKVVKRGYKVWPISPDIGKSELYGWLRLPPPAPGEEAAPGYCHFPEYDEEYFKQLTAEHLVTIVNKKTGRQRLEWQVIPNRQNHGLDRRILARVAAAVLGLDKFKPKGGRSNSAAPPKTPRAEEPPPPREPVSARMRERKKGSWLSGGGRASGGWLGKRR